MIDDGNMANQVVRGGGEKKTAEFKKKSNVYNPVQYHRLIG